MDRVLPWSTCFNLLVVGVPSFGREEAYRMNQTSPNSRLLRNAEVGTEKNFKNVKNPDPVQSCSLGNWISAVR